MTSVSGRLPEKKELDRALHSSNAELIVVYGRRRVGKTFLIREHLQYAQQLVSSQVTLAELFR